MSFFKFPLLLLSCVCAAQCTIRTNYLQCSCAIWPPELSLLQKGSEFYSENTIKSFSWTGQTHSCLLMQPVCDPCSLFTAELILSLSKWSFTELCISGSDWTFSDKDVFWLAGQHQLSSCLQNYVSWISFAFHR